MTFTGFPRPFGSNDPGVQALSRFGSERQTGLLTATLPLENAPVDGTLQIFKNGALLDPGAAYTLSGKTVTLGVAAIGADVFLVFYHYSQNGA